ncbi:MAG: hypothetical protein CVT62_08890 [Actinobacteria bacterium HGW-Actinobacteria-2]|nr:MAG: hypothetical protein CVT62_08890 [Actinobacteria bacterium HGW-Actinobacteria-2]
MTEWVFSYGTLRLAQVQQATYGRLLDGHPDRLPGYRLDSLPITNPDVVAISGAADHPVAVPGTPQDEIDGLRLALTSAELAATDTYEAADYVRMPVVLASGTAAWLYVAKS